MRGGVAPGAGGSPLRGLLRDAARLCPALEDALLVDAEGILVEAFRPAATAVDQDEVGVEAVGAIPAHGRTAVAARLGAIVEWTLVGERGILVVRRVPGASLYLVLRVPDSEFVGRARFAARMTAQRLAEFA